MIMRNANKPPETLNYVNFQLISQQTQHEEEIHLKILFIMSEVEEFFTEFDDQGNDVADSSAIETQGKILRSSVFKKIKQETEARKKEGNFIYLSLEETSAAISQAKVDDDIGIDGHFFDDCGAGYERGSSSKPQTPRLYTAHESGVQMKGLRSPSSMVQRQV